MAAKVSPSSGTSPSGGGGVAGIAWHTGVLAGLVRAGADPTGAELLVGTSAGATVGAQSGKFLIWLCCLNIVPLVVNFSGAAPWLLIGLLALVLPPRFIKE